LGFPTGCNLHAIKHFIWRRCRGEIRYLQGKSLMLNLLLCYCFALLYFYLHLFIKNTKKISSLIVVTFTCLLLVLLEWVLLRTPNCVILLAPKTIILESQNSKGKMQFFDVLVFGVNKITKFESLTHSAWVKWCATGK
jgi:hypothetical protein